MDAKLKKRLQFLTQDWKAELTWMAILYRIDVVGERIPWVLTVQDDQKFVEGHLNKMRECGLVEVKDADRYILTSDGRSFLRTMQEMFDVVVKFEVFARVDISRVLTDDECQWKDVDGEDVRTNFVQDYLYDPRFPSPDEPNYAQGEDMRLAMINFLGTHLSEKLGGHTIDPRRVVFLQQLVDQKLREDQFWFDLKVGTFFGNIEEIVANAYQWQNVAGSVTDHASEADRDQAASEIMLDLYTAGMLEVRKSGPGTQECSKCGTPLGVFELLAKEDGHTLDCCPKPGCGASYIPPEPPPSMAEYSCDNCGTDVFAGQRRCRCGVDLNFSLPSGTVETTTETTVEFGNNYYDVWGPGYVYDPYYYDPWDPFVDTLVFGCLLGVGVALIID